MHGKHIDQAIRYSLPPRSIAHRGVTAAAIALAVALGSSRIAIAEHFVEFQIASSKLVQLVQHRLLEEEICSQSTFELPFRDGEYMYDHIEFPGPVTIKRDGEQILIGVPFRLFTKTPACLSNPNCGTEEYSPPSPTLGELELALTAQVDDDNRLSLCVELDTLIIDGLPISPATLHANLASSMAGLLSPKCSSVNVMHSLEKLLGKDRTVRQVGVGANESLTRIAVRIELDSPSPPVGAPNGSSWPAFFDGSIAPTASGMDWSLFVNQDLLKAASIKKFQDSMGNHGVEITSGPTVAYAPQGNNGARIELNMNLELDVDECPITTVGVEPAIVTMDLFVNAGVPNVVQTHGLIDADVNDEDVLLCALGFGPLGVISLPVLGAIAANEGPSEDQLPDECNQITNEEFACTQPISLPVIQLTKWPSAIWSTRAGLSLKKLFGHDSGIILGGPVGVTIGLPTSPKRGLETTPGFFIFGVQGGCSSLHLGWSGAMGISGDGRLCGIDILQDPLGIYGVNYAWEPHALGSTWIGDLRNVELQFPRGTNYDEFVADAYPCILRIRTSAGSQCIAIPAPDVENINMGDALHALAKAKANCLKPKHFGVAIDRILWAVNPPPFDIDVATRFDDPFVYTQDVTAQVVDMQVSIDGLVSTDAVVDGQAQLPQVTMMIQAEVVVNAGAARPSFNATGFAFGKSFAGAKSKNGAVGDPRNAKPSDSIVMTIYQPVTVNLVATIVDNGEDQVGMIEAIEQVVTVPEDQLPEGVSELSFVIDIPADRFTMVGELEEVNLSEPEAPLDQSCGGGVCGAGGAAFMPLMALGWCAMKRRRH